MDNDQGSIQVPLILKVSLYQPCFASRMDADQATRRIAQEEFDIVDPDFYEFEANIFFDDAMELDEKNTWTVNQFVKLFLGTLDEAAR